MANIKTQEHKKKTLTHSRTSQSILNNKNTVTTSTSTSTSTCYPNKVILKLESSYKNPISPQGGNDAIRRIAQENNLNISFYQTNTGTSKKVLTSQWQKKDLIKKTQKKALFVSTKLRSLRVTSEKSTSPSSVHLKKKGKMSLTVISGPHVHKKSREQLALTNYSTFHQINIQDISDFKNFLVFKQSLSDKFINNGFQISYSYSINETICI